MQKSKEKTTTVPATGPSGASIRPGVIRAMESQQKASQKALDALSDLVEDVKRATKLGILRDAR